MAVTISLTASAVTISSTPRSSRGGRSRALRGDYAVAGGGVNSERPVRDLPHVLPSRRTWRSEGPRDGGDGRDGGAAGGGGARPRRPGRHRPSPARGRAAGPGLPGRGVDG